MSKFQASSKKAEKLVKKYSEHIPPEDPTTAPEYDASNFGDFHTYYEHKKQKLQNRNALLRLHTAGEGYPQIFRGVVAWVNGYTAPSAQDLMEMIVVRGGVMLQYLEGKTALTHVIASKLTPKKLVEWQRYRVVRPEWVVECVKEGKLLPWEKWRVGTGGVAGRQGRLGFGKVGGEGEQSQALRVEKGTREGSYKQQDLERLRSGSGSGSGSGTPVTRSQRMGFPGSALGRRVEEIGDVGDEEEGEQAVKEEEEASKRPSSSSNYIPFGREFAVVIPRRKDDGPVVGDDAILPPQKRVKMSIEVPQRPPKARTSTPQQPKRSPIPPASQRARTSTPRLPSRLSIPPPPLPPSPDLDPDSADLFPSYQLPPLPPSSPSGEKDEIPPSHQPTRRLLEIPESSPPPLPPSSQSALPARGRKDVNNADDEDEYFNALSFTKSEGDAVEDLMKGICDSTSKSIPREILPTSPVEEDLLTEDELGGVSELLPDIPPSTQPPPSTQKRGREISSQPDIPQLVLTPPQPASLVKKEVTSPPAPHQPPAKRQKTRDEHGHDETAKLLANPHIRNSTVLNPGFLKQYYQESRLHHLSTWKANLKQHLQELVLSVPTPSQSNQPPPPRRYIFHIDFDCFFAAVSILYHPNPASLEGKPVCVTHATGASGDVASCNYTARARGVKNGMWLGQAKELCPEIICLPYEFERYEEVSRAFYGILIDVAKQKIGVVVQSVSVDEAVMDVTPLCYDSTSKGSIKKEQDIADSLASSIRSKVKETTRCDVSIGISSNPLLARLALRRAKPSGQVQLRPGNETNEFLGPLRVQDLPSVGSSTAGKLAANGVTNIEQLRELSMHKLKDIVGDKTGGRLFNYARGIDDTPVTGAGGADTAERKSVSADVNWGVRFETQEQAEEFLLNLAGEVKRRLEEQGVKGRKLTLKVMKRAAGAPIVTPKFLGSGKCDTLCKSVHVGEEGKATWDPEILGKEAVKILRGFSSDPKELRGLGMQMTKLEKAAGIKVEGERAKGQNVLQFKPVDKKNLSVPQGLSKRQFEKSPLMPPPPVPQDTPARKPRPPADTTPSHGPPSTQFLVPSPSQIDHSVLDELPSPIRRSILEAAAAFSSKNNIKSKAPPPPPPPPPVKTLHFPAPLAPITRPNLQENKQPTPISSSQIDPEFLESLTPSLREEILSEYRAASKARAAQRAPPPPPAAVATVTTTTTNFQQPIVQRGTSASPGKRKEKQTLLPNSPRKNHLLKRPISPPKRRGGNLGGSSHASGSGKGGGGGGGVVLFPASNTTTTRPSSRGSGGGGDPFKSHDTPPPPLAPQQVAPLALAAAASASAKQQLTLPLPPPPGVPLSPTTISALLPAKHNLDPETLSHLPRDILDEVIADARRRANLTAASTNAAVSTSSSTTSNTNTNQNNINAVNSYNNNDGISGPGIRCLKLSVLPRPVEKELPRFQRLREVGDIVELLEQWYCSLMGGGGDEEEQSGPNVEDVQVLVRYLGEVVCVERDMAKARRMVRGFGGVVLEGGDGRRGKGKGKEGKGTARGGKEERAREEWVDALRMVVRGVKEACVRRGVPEMDVGFEEEIGGV